MENPTNTARGLYEKLRESRSPFEQRARDCASVTIPSLFPHEGASGATKFNQPYQSVGARGVNNLASKILLALFPPGTSFFRLKIMGDTLQEILEQGEQTLSEFEAALAKSERSVMDYFEASNARAILYEFFRQLITTGNALLFVQPSARFKLYRLNQYVVERDLLGNLTRVITVEGVAPETLSGPALEVYNTKKSTMDPADAKKRSVDIYTSCAFRDGRWGLHQELFETEIPGTRSFYPKDKLPLIPQRWVALPTEDYGRSHVEEYLGDIISYNAISRAIVEFSAAAAKIVFMVAPGSPTRIKDLNEARSGAFVKGVKKDVEALQLDKFADFQVTASVAGTIEKRLEHAFLLNTSVQRNAERVTAEEIRFIAGELEQALGGVYTVLSQDLQIPLVEVLTGQLRKAGKFPSLPKEAVRPMIVTGLEGLGRSTDFARLQALMQGDEQVFTPETREAYFNPGDYYRRKATALGIDPEGLVRSDEEVQAAQQAAQQAAMDQTVAPQVVKASADLTQAAAQETPMQGA